MNTAEQSDGKRQEYYERLMQELSPNTPFMPNTVEYTRRTRVEKPGMSEVREMKYQNHPTQSYSEVRRKMIQEQKNLTDEDFEAKDREVYRLSVGVPLGLETGLDEEIREEKNKRMAYERRLERSLQKTTESMESVERITGFEETAVGKNMIASQISRIERRIITDNFEAEKANRKDFPKRRSRSPPIETQGVTVNEFFANPNTRGNPRLATRFQSPKPIRGVQVAQEDGYSDRSKERVAARKPKIELSDRKVKVVEYDNGSVYLNQYSDQKPKMTPMMEKIEAVRRQRHLDQLSEILAEESKARNKSKEYLKKQELILLGKENQVLGLARNRDPKPVKARDSIPVRVKLHDNEELNSDTVLLPNERVVHHSHVRHEPGANTMFESVLNKEYLGKHQSAESKQFLDECLEQYRIVHKVMSNCAEFDLPVLRIAKTQTSKP